MARVDSTPPKITACFDSGPSAIMFAERTGVLYGACVGSGVADVDSFELPDTRESSFELVRPISPCKSAVEEG